MSWPFGEDDWSNDFDNDGLVNLLDSDSDGDRFIDGSEVAEGHNPSDPISKPKCMKIWIEEAEDGILTFQ